VQRGDHACRRAAERHRHDRRALARQQRELGVPAVVVVARRADRRPDARGIGRPVLVK